MEPVYLSTDETEVIRQEFKLWDNLTNFTDGGQEVKAKQALVHLLMQSVCLGVRSFLDASSKTEPSLITSDQIQAFHGLHSALYNGIRGVEDTLSHYYRLACFSILNRGTELCESLRPHLKNIPKDGNIC